jgi:hypothetical protein
MNRTAPSPILRVHHLTDTHYPRTANRLFGYFEMVRTAPVDQRPDLILHTGDLVDGEGSQLVPPQMRWPLREQHQRLKQAVDRLGIPFHAICHTHDRKGDPDGQWGKAFMEVWQQPLLQVLQLPANVDVILASGSVSLPPFANGAVPPAWGFDLFDLHVLEQIKAVATSQLRPGSLRLLCAHIPPHLPEDFFDQPARYSAAPIGDEGCARIHPVLQQLDIRIVLSGHLHRAAQSTRNTITFVVGSSTLEPYGGYGELLISNGCFEYRSQSIPHLNGNVAVGG